MKVQATSKKQPREEYIKAVAKIVEALDPIHGFDRAKCLQAAMILLGDPEAARKLMEART